MLASRTHRRLALRSLVVVLTTIIGLAIATLPALAALGISSFTPTSGPEGTVVTINGTDFSSGISSVKFHGVPSVFGVNSDTKITATVPATNTGRIVVTTTSGAYAASATNFVVRPSIKLTPAVGPPTTNLTIQGSGFPSSKAIDIYFDGTLQTSDATDGHGVFATDPTKVSAAAQPGAHTVVARTSSTSARATFTVRTDWASFRNGLARRGWNPYENTLSPSNVSGLDAHWVYTTEAAIQSSSPAVANGVVYVGSTDDNMYALNASTGALLWSYTTEGNIESSPAVANGVVYFGSDDGNMHALNASTGALLWLNNFTGDPFASSPAVANGMVYVGSDNGNVYALAVSTGARVWNYLTGGAIDSSPAVVNGVVYVSSGNNVMYALNASTGALRWSSSGPTGGGGSPAVVNGVVYVGSGGGEIYALTASTGAVRWSYFTGDSVESSPAVANGVLYVSSSDSNVYAFDLNVQLKGRRLP